MCTALLCWWEVLGCLCSCINCAPDVILVSVMYLHHAHCWFVRIVLNLLLVAWDCFEEVGDVTNVGLISPESQTHCSMLDACRSVMQHITLLGSHFISS